MNTTRYRLLAAALLAGIGYTGSAAPAEADVMLVIMDLSGSMTSSRPVDVHGGTRFDAAKSLARDAVNAMSTGRRYGLWTFNGRTHAEIVDIEDHPTSEASRSAVLDAIDRLPPPSSTTPLAMTLCDAVDELLPYYIPFLPGVTPDERPIIQLFSDGLENSSTGDCAGPAAVNHLDPEEGSWEYLVRTKARYGTLTEPETEPPPFAYTVVNADFLFEHETTIVSRALPAPGTGLASAQPPPKKKSPLAQSLQYEGLSLIGNPAVQLQIHMDFFLGLAGLTSGSYRQFADSQALPQLGDFTGDRCVDLNDYQKLVDNWGRTVPRRSAVDPNGDGRVNTDDYLTLMQNYGEGCKQ